MASLLENLGLVDVQVMKVQAHENTSGSHSLGNGWLSDCRYRREITINNTGAVVHFLRIEITAELIESLFVLASHDGSVCNSDLTHESRQWIYDRADRMERKQKDGVTLPNTKNAPPSLRPRDEEDFHLYQNWPNPLYDQTTIGFYLPIATSAKLTIFDAKGTILKVIQEQYDRGYHEIQVAYDQIGVSGLVYYQLETEQSLATKRMTIQH